MVIIKKYMLPKIPFLYIGSVFVQVDRYSKNITTSVKLPDIGSPILITFMGNDSPEAKDATKPCESSSVPGRVGVADPEPDRLPPPCPPEIKLYCESA